MPPRPAQRQPQVIHKVHLGTNVRHLQDVPVLALPDRHPLVLVRESTLYG